MDKVSYSGCACSIRRVQEFLLECYIEMFDEGVEDGGTHV